MVELARVGSSSGECVVECGRVGSSQGRVW